MDDAERAQKQNEIATIEAYLNQPISREIEAERVERENALLGIIVDRDIDDIPTFFVHMLAIGELRGLRRGRRMVTAKLQEIKDELKES